MKPDAVGPSWIKGGQFLQFRRSLGATADSRRVLASRSSADPRWQGVGIPGDLRLGEVVASQQDLPEATRRRSCGRSPGR
jgi:hypothetical protein